VPLNKRSKRLETEIYMPRATKAEAHAAVVSRRVLITRVECESNSSLAGKWTDSVQALWGRPVKIGLAKVQDLDATHTLEVELSF
jgi:uncharacterized Zn finger protein